MYALALDLNGYGSVLSGRRLFVCRAPHVSQVCVALISAARSSYQRWLDISTHSLIWWGPSHGLSFFARSRLGRRWLFGTLLTISNWELGIWFIPKCPFQMFTNSVLNVFICFYILLTYLPAWLLKYFFNVLIHTLLAHLLNLYIHQGLTDYNAFCYPSQFWIYTRNSEHFDQKIDFITTWRCSTSR